MLRNGIQKDMFTLIICLTSVRRNVAIDNLVGKLANISASFPEPSTVNHPVQVLESISDNGPLLGGIECIRKSPLPNNLRVCETASGLAKQKRCCSIESQAEEERLQINDPVAFSNQPDEIIGRFLEYFKALIMLVLQLRSQHIPGVFPVSAFLRENTVTKRRKQDSSTTPKTKIYL